MKFENKVVLVTGSSRGIGRATALKFAEEGAKVIINYLNSEEVKAEEVVEEIKKIGSDALAIRCDVSLEKEVKDMVEKAIKKFGRIDVLVNNAGIVYDVPLFEKTVEQWRETLNVNLIGVFLCSKYVSKKMLEQGSGNIVNISSTNGINCPSPESADYDASKSGVISLTKNLAEELAPNIRVNSVAPGWVDTEMNKDLPKDFVKKEKGKTFLKRFARPEEISSVVLFLASEDSSFMTGSTMVVDGGYK
jgi:3-oxoacyl-[acyl-carrier protein] reductase